METKRARQIAPVLVLSTGRCGSTMLSDVLNTHPEVLSLSEFYASLGMKALARKRLNGKAMWGICCRHSPGLRAMLAGGKDRILYPFDDPQARFSRRNIPSILCTTLPHLTPDFENLYDELGPVVRARPKETLADQYRFLFEWLCDQFARSVWVERSGGSLMMGVRLMRLFPEARVVHIYRDGRDTALSMSQHRGFKVGLALTQKLQRMGIDLFANPFRTPPPALALFMLRFVNLEKLMRQQFDLEAYGDLWSRMILSGQAYLSTLPAERLLALRYEDVLERPREKLRQLIEFIDPGLVDDKWLDKASLIPRPNPAKYLALDAETRQRLTFACAPGLKALGYET